MQLGDKDFIREDADQYLQQLVEILGRKIDKNPNTVAMILLHLELQGYRLDLLDTEEGRILMQKKREILSRLSAQDLSALSENAAGMFVQFNKLVD